MVRERNERAEKSCLLYGKNLCGNAIPSISFHSSIFSFEHVYHRVIWMISLYESQYLRSDCKLPSGFLIHFHQWASEFGTQYWFQMY
jgi:hypothetical protein